MKIKPDIILIEYHSNENRRLIDLLIERGQKRIFLVNGSIDVQELAKNSSFPPGIVLHKTHDFMEIQDLILLFNICCNLYNA